MNFLIPTPPIIVSALLAIYGKYSQGKYIHYVFKPLTIILIIFFAMARRPDTGSFYKFLIIAALLLSLIGDILLMLPKSQFIQGLLAFSIAHIIYCLAFMQNVGRFYFLILIPILFYGTSNYFVLSKNLSKLRIPVFFYVMIITLMGWLAVNRYLNFQDSKGLYTLIGGILFLISDSILAINKFKKHFKFAEVIILGSYFSAQLFFALSI
jgi:uncharacterized membrane protein YhhN